VIRKSSVSSLPLALIAACCSWTLPLFNVPKAAIFKLLRLFSEARMTVKTGAAGFYVTHLQYKLNITTITTLLPQNIQRDVS
jgi:hypothetical protein